MRKILGLIAITFPLLINEGANAQAPNPNFNGQSQPSMNARWIYVVQLAPGTQGSGFYCMNNCGVVYGPNYCVRPPFQPFNGIGVVPGGCQEKPFAFPGMSFPSHPFARSPRDFFMVD